MKPGVDDENYYGGTWMISDWVVNNSNNSSAKDVGRGKNNVQAVCTNKLGWPFNNFELRKPKEILDIMQGSYSCTTRPSMKRMRSPWPRDTFRTPTPTGSWRARRSSPIRGRRRRPGTKTILENNLSLSVSLGTEKELPVHLQQPDSGQVQDHRAGDVGGGGYHCQVRHGDGVYGHLL